MLATSAASAGEQGSLPVRYHGHWSLSSEQCAAGRLDGANIRLGARFFEDFNARMDVRYVSAQRDGSLIIGGKVGSGADGYDNVKRLALLENGTALAVGEGEDHALYVRCKP